MKRNGIFHQLLLDENAMLKSGLVFFFPPKKFPILGGRFANYSSNVLVFFVFHIIELDNK